MPMPLVWASSTAFHEILLGMPAKAHNVVVGTALPLSWVGCDPWINGCSSQFFHPSVSSTYNVVGCTSALCNAISSATVSGKSYITPSQRWSYNQTLVSPTMVRLGLARIGCFRAWHRCSAPWTSWFVSLQNFISVVLCLPIIDMIEQWWFWDHDYMLSSREKYSYSS